MNYLSRTIFLFIIIVQIGSLTSCKKDYICPAYQSYFLLDSTKREQHFSLFGEDSLPKVIVEVKKSKVGIMEEMAYRKKNTLMQSLPMNVIYPERKDSVMLEQDTLQNMIKEKQAGIVENH